MQYDDSGRPFAQAEGHRKKENHVEVRVYPHGSGKITIDGKPLMEFPDQARSLRPHPIEY